MKHIEPQKKNKQYKIALTEAKQAKNIIPRILTFANTIDNEEGFEKFYVYCKYGGLLLLSKEFKDEKGRSYYRSQVKRIWKYTAKELDKNIAKLEKQIEAQNK